MLRINDKIFVLFKSGQPVLKGDPQEIYKFKTFLFTNVLYDNYGHILSPISPTKNEYYAIAKQYNPDFVMPVIESPDIPEGSIN